MASLLSLPSLPAGEGAGIPNGASRSSANPAASTATTRATANNTTPRHSSYMTPVLLSDGQDADHLSEGMCYLRQQIEWFTATTADVAARGKKGGPTKVLPGSVGMRCVHCAHLPPERQANGSSTFPRRIGLVHQAVRNWQRYHLSKCPVMPEEVRTTFQGLKKTSKNRTAGAHWEDSCRRKGLYDATVEVDAKSIEVIRYRNECDVGDSSADGTADAAIPVAADARGMGAGQNMSEQVATATSAPAAAPTSAVEPSPSMMAYHSPPKRSTSITQGDGCLSPLQLHALDGPKDERNTTAMDASTGPMSPLAIDDEDSLLQSALVGGGGLVDLLGSLDVVDQQQQQQQQATDSTSISTSARGGKRRASFTRASFTGTFTENSSVNNPQSMSQEDLSQEDRASMRELADLLAIDVDDDMQMAAVAADGSHHGNQLGAHHHQPQTRGTDNVITPEAILDKVRLARNMVDATLTLGDSPLHSLLDGVEDEMLALGEALYETFAGFRPSTNHCTANSEKDSGGGNQRDKRGRSKQKIVPLSELGCPQSISNLVFHLLRNDSCGRGPYTSASDISQALQYMLDDPKRYLFSHSNGVVHFASDRLYGRKEEELKMMQVYNRVIAANGECEILLISGQSGIGKTSLALELKQPIEAMGGFFLSGKFDELRQVDPLSALFSAFNDLCAKLSKEDDSAAYVQLKQNINQSLGQEGKILTTLLPNLTNITGPPDDSVLEDVESSGALARILFFLRQFTFCLAKQEHPVILLLDDLQRADSSSMELIRHIITGSDLTSFMLIACYRDNEVTSEHPLQVEMRAIEECGVQINHVNLGALSQKATEMLVADALSIMPIEARSLAKTVHSKTTGNALFVRQFLMNLQDEGLLSFSLSLRQWVWDAEAISAKTITGSVADLMTDRMLRYPAEVLRCLKLVACIGYRCERSTLEMLGTDDTDLSMILALTVAVTDGLLIESSKHLTFSHDQIQQAAYNLATEEEQTTLHLHIARLLHKRASKAYLDEIIFTVVDQYHRGRDLIEGREEKTDVASLHFIAGDKARATCSFPTAAKLFIRAMGFVDEKHWGTDYMLMLNLWTAAAEMNNFLGSLEEVERLSAIIFERARTLADKLPAYYSLMDALGAKGKHSAAVDIGLNVLEELGHPILLKGESEEAIKETLAMASSLSNSDILSREMNDENSIYEMRIMNPLIPCCFVARPDLMVGVACRMIQMSIEHGISRYSAYGVAIFGYLLSLEGRIQLSYEYGKLALAILEHFNVNEFVPRVYLVVYTMILPVEPIQASFSQLDRAFNLGIQYGDIDKGAACARVGLATRFYHGDKLGLLLESGKDYVKAMTVHRTEYVRLSTTLFLQAAKNLTDVSCQNASVLQDQEKTLELAARLGSGNRLYTVILSIRIYLSYIFCMDDLAGALVEERERIKKEDGKILASNILNDTLYTGLVAAVLARTRDRSKWEPIALECKAKLAGWCKESEWNYAHGLKLIEAELAYMDGRNEVAAKSYNDAIACAAKHRFIHEEAVAYERASIFHADVSGSDSPLARAYLGKAKDLYLEWGAKRKAINMDSLLSGSCMKI